MSENIDVIDETNTLTDERIELVKNVILFSYKHLELDETTECSLVFVHEDRIQELNRDYRNKDAVTDVLSFALNDDEQMPGDEHVLGDIVICVERMKEQAEEYEHSIERELAFLSVHGLLHLLGYDHMDEEEEREMFTLQEELLSAYGLGREA
ncbi:MULTISPECIES: rRNA maturation RNase YbeY [Geomicrobium]|uniref:Endoribonuclease YbeY n=1 Tax=Geomicrobium sediminis TaxID=1347788 RepID=A0ABS2PEA1_9BACL|nr:MULTISPECIES: rRNA maturation RNase YbeY [Geomicrobium]MBM7633754.1 putative rRNA maturation factor [Geomicrobium sediminis]GAK06440.1 metal-dependent hydrolase [Geomicrobium sp. JCM 19038]